MFERIAPEQYDTIEGIPEPAENLRLIGHRQTSKMLAQPPRRQTAAWGARGGSSRDREGNLGVPPGTPPPQASRREKAPDELVVPDPGTSLFRQIATGAHPSVLHLTRPMNEKTSSFKSVVTVDEIRRVNRLLSTTSTTEATGS